MTSLINPVDIDEKFPVAGQDNPSQGFRDNFAVIQQNFEHARTEITELQNKALFKVPLGDSDLSNNLNGADIVSANMLDMRLKRSSIGAVSGIAQIDVALASYYTIATAGVIMLEFESWPEAGNYSSVYLEVSVTDTTHHIVLPVGVGSGETSRAMKSIIGMEGNTLRFGSTGTRLYKFSSDDQGATILIEELTNGLYSGVSSVINGTDIDMSASAFTIATNGPSTAVVKKGAQGEIKTFAMTHYNGDMHIQVIDYGWLGTGYITFNAVGKGCTIQFLNGKWYGIGNNGCTFS